MGLSAAGARRAVAAALSGFVHARANPPATRAEVLKRLERIEQRLP